MNHVQGTVRALAVCALLALVAPAQTWSGFGPGVGDWVYATAEFEGDLIVGGKFTSAGGVAANHVARWDGSSWSALGTGVDGDVWALCVYQGELYAAGDFYYADGQEVKFLARWDGAAWVEMSGGANSSVRTMCVWNGLLVVGGYFTSVDGPKNYVAAWDGSDWEALGAGVGGSQGQVLGLAAWNGDLYATGFFTTAGGAPANRVAKWNGTTWSALGSGLNGIGYCMTARANGVVVGGGFGTAGGLPASDVAFWNGTAWSGYGSGVGGGTYGIVLAVAEYDGDLMAGGIFTTAGGASAANVARWNGTTWSPLASSMGSGGTVQAVYALSRYADGLAAGGIFYSVDGALSLGNVAVFREGYDAYGSGCVGYAGLVPLLYGTGVPRSEWLAGVALVDAAPNASAVFAFATAAAADPLGGCTLLLGGAFLLLAPAYTDATGSAAVEFLVPPGVAPGTRLYAQCAVVDAASSNGLFTLSNGVEILFH